MSNYNLYGQTDLKINFVLEQYIMAVWIKAKRIQVNVDCDVCLFSCAQSIPRLLRNHYQNP